MSARKPIWLPLPKKLKDTNLILNLHQTFANNAMRHIKRCWSWLEIKLCENYHYSMLSYKGHLLNSKLPPKHLTNKASEKRLDSSFANNGSVFFYCKSGLGFINLKQYHSFCRSFGFNTIIWRYLDKYHGSNSWSRDSAWSQRPWYTRIFTLWAYQGPQNWKWRTRWESLMASFVRLDCTFVLRKAEMFLQSFNNRSVISIFFLSL